MELDLFMPSSRVLEAIAWDKKAHRQYTTFPADTPEVGLASYTGLSDQEIRNFYNHQFKIELYPEENAIIPYRHVIAVFWEALVNSQKHGSKKGTPFTHALFLARKGICQGFRDGGEYFQDARIKKQFESKTPITEFDQETENCFRIGVNDHIYPFSDIIEVDDNKGILYCARLF